MKKFETVLDLLKAGGLHGHFQKAADHHAAMAKAHGEHAAFVKAKADAMSDDDAHKAYFGKAAECHAALEKLHKAHADHHAAMADNTDADKADAPADATKAAGAGDSATIAATADMGGFMRETMKAAMEELKSDPGFKETFKKMIADEAKKMLSGTVIPDHVKSAVDPATNPNLKLVPRPGGPSTEDAGPKVPLQHAHLVEE